MKREKPRTEQEIYARMWTIVNAWKEIDAKKLESREDMKEVFENQLEALYWVLGYDLDDAADMASVVLGGDPIDVS